MPEIRPQHVLLQAGGEIAARFGAFVIPGAGRQLIEEFKEAHTRASIATFQNRDGRGQVAAVDKPRPHWIRNAGSGLFEPYWWLESLRAQLVPDPENFGAAGWTTVAGTGTRTGGQADPFGGTSAYLIADTDAANVFQIQEIVAFTGDGTKGVAIFVKAGSSGETNVRLRDTTAGADRFGVKVTWTAGVPTTAVIGGAGGAILAVEPWGNGWYRILGNATGVVAANTNQFILTPTNFTASSVADSYFFGANAWNALYPSSYQGPTLATKQLESVVLPFPYAPEALFVYMKFRERGNADGVGVSRLWRIGSNADGLGTPALYVTYNTQYGTRLNVGGNITSGVIAGTPAYDDIVELLVTMAANGLMQCTLALNGGAPSVGTAAGAQTLPAAWSDANFYLAGMGAVLTPLARLIVGRSVQPSLADVQSYIAAS